MGLFFFHGYKGNKGYKGYKGTQPSAAILTGSVAALLLLLAASCCLGQVMAPSGALPVRPLAAAVKGDIAGVGHFDIQTSTPGDVLHMTVGRSVVLTTRVPLRRVYVGNPAVLQTFTSSSTELVLTAKTVGVSSMVLWDTTGSHRLYTVSADLDGDGLRRSMQEAFPGTGIHAETSEGKVYLSGEVASDAASTAAVKLASLYSKDVVNSLRVVVVHGKQVQLKLRIVEVDRTKLEQFGVNLFTGGKNLINTSTQQYSSSVTGVGTPQLAATDPLNLMLYNFSHSIGLTVKDLEQRQILQVLAEPTLTTLSGQPARFLSGGEFPFPVVEGGIGSNAAITIMFRPYGVKVEFTPTVNADGSIRLKVSPEVSTLDFTNAVTISGFTIPALSTRRAETEVEILDGQSFVVSGLLDHRTTDSLSKVPGIGNIPILGQLFRSKSLNHSVVELVVIVTATVVDPLTNPAAAVEPAPVVPEMNSGTFDKEMQGLLKTSTPASANGPAPAKPLAGTPATGSPAAKPAAGAK